MRPADADAVTTNLHINQEVNNEIQDLLKKQGKVIKRGCDCEKVEAKQPNQFLNQ